ncbi:hypothetical protein D3C87_855410 [compost metagenome]
MGMVLVAAPSFMPDHALRALSRAEIAPRSAWLTLRPVWAAEDGAAFDRSYKQAGKLASQLALKVDGTFRQTALRLGDVSRQEPGELAREPVAIETTRTQWPIVTYLVNGDRLTRIPDTRPLLSSSDLAAVTARKPGAFVRGSTLVMAISAGAERYTTAEIPLAAMTDPLSDLQLGGGAAVLLLDAEGNPIGRKGLDAEDRELLRSVSTEAATTLVSKTSLLSLARIPSAGWTVLVRIPLAEAYQGFSLPEVDARSFPEPLYLVKRAKGASLEGVGKGILLTGAGLGLLMLALGIARRWFRDPKWREALGRRARLALRNRFAEEPAPFAALASNPSGGLSVLEALVDERNALSTPPTPPTPPPLAAPEGATSGVWREALQAQVAYLLSELTRTQEQVRTLTAATSPELVERRMDALREAFRDLERDLEAKQEGVIQDFTEALKQRLDVDARRLEGLEQAVRQQQEAVSKAGTLQSRVDDMSEGLRQRFAQEDQLLAALDQEVSALRAQQAHLAEASESKLGMLASEVEGYRNQGAQGDRQAIERIEVLAKALQELHASNGKLRQDVHGALQQAQRENTSLREEVGKLAARVHRVVQLLAKGRPA